MVASIFPEFSWELFSPAIQLLAILSLSVLNPGNYKVPISTCLPSSVISPWQNYQASSYPTNGMSATLHIDKASTLPIPGGIHSTTLSKPEPHSWLYPGSPFSPSCSTTTLYITIIIQPWRATSLKNFLFSTLDPFGFFFHQESLPCYQLISQCPDCSQLNSWDLAWSFPLKLIVFSTLYPPVQFLLHCTPTTFSILVNLYLYLLY